MEEKRLWWQTGVIYQIYPRSFMDSNGDGVGDIPGIISRLDYLEWLGVDAIWLSPIYPSPMADFGYDVADYTGIHPLFGTLDDFDRLLQEAHGRGIRVILDLVPNHSSDQHPWFLESRSSRDNPKRDWYIWRDPAPEGGPPNNWLSVFGGSAWEWDPTTGQYYLHSFLKEQPDLNWRNPEVREAIYDAMRFWLDRGVDGFRVDVIWLMIKDDQFRDNPPNPQYRVGENPSHSQIQLYTQDRPEVHDVIREMRGVLDEYDERMMVGEIYLPLRQLVAYYGENLDETHMAFNFQLILLPWNIEVIRRYVEEYEAALPRGAWPNWVLGNHDNSRVASRVGPEQARLAQMLLLTLRGTPTCYYGDELGMTDVEIPPDKLQDPQGLRLPGLGLSRDPERTPMQWDGSPHAGFSTTEPWLPVAPDYPRVNVEVQRQDPTSMLSLVRGLISLRRSVPALQVGSYAPVDAGHGQAFAYVREHGGSRVVVALNFGGEALELDLRKLNSGCRVEISSHLDRNGYEALGSLKLRGNEGIVATLDG